MKQRGTCTFPACEKPHEALGLCPGHYEQQRQGKPLTPLRKREVMPVINGHKVCTQCRVFKPVDEYYLKRGKPMAYCKTCIIANAAANYRVRHPKTASAGL